MRAASKKNCIGRVSPASGQAQKSQPRVSMRVGTGRGGRADTLFAGKAERTAKIAIERQTRSLACCRRAKALHAGDERKPCVLASSGNVGRCAQKAWADPSLRAWADRLPGPPTFHLVSGTIAGAMSPEGTSKRRWCSSESRPLIWYRLTRIPAEIHTTTCQATASKYSDGISSKYSDGISSKYSDGISTMQAEALAKSLQVRV